MKIRKIDRLRERKVDKQIDQSKKGRQIDILTLPILKVPQ